MTDHLDEQQLHKFLAGELPEAEHAAADSHIEACATCQKVIENIESNGLPPSAVLRDFRREPAAGPPASGASAPSAAVLATSPLFCLPGYAELEEIGQGGMGVVYRARQIALNRVVALKMIRVREAPGTPPKALSGLREEGEKLARVQHPGIVRVYDCGMHNDIPYLAMEWCDGGSLADRLARGPLSSKEAAELVRLLALAIHATHLAHIIHRDLKPANVLFDGENHPKVADFGIARFLDDGKKTQTAEPIGTASYMAPEQVRSEKVGPATDVYALGAILYECLTGRPPFQAADRIDTVLQVIGQDPVPPRRLNPAVPRDLETICLCCLEKEPTRRYSNARELAEDLQRFQNKEPIQARRVTWIGRGWRWCCRNPWVATLIAVVGALLVVTGVFAGQQHIQSQREQVRLDAERLVEEGERHLSAGQYASAIEPLTQALTRMPATDFPELRERGDRALTRANGRIRLVEFRATASRAEHHLLGAYWILMEHEDPKAHRRILRPNQLGADLPEGITLAGQALQVYGLPEDLQGLDRLDRDGIEGKEAEAIRTQAGELLFLWGLAVERLRQGQAEDVLRDARRQAVGLLNTAEAVGNQSRVLYRYRAKFQRALGENAGADADEKKASTIKTSTFLDHSFQAAELNIQRKWAASLDEFHQALAFRPNDYWSLRRLADSLEQQKQYGQAEAVLRSCLILRPQDAMMYNDRGSLLNRQGRWNEAVPLFEKAIELDPDHLMAHTNLILAHAERKNVPDAEAALNRCLKRQPTPTEQAKAWTHFGLAFERTNQLDLALQHYSQAVKCDAEYAQALRNRAALLNRLKRPDAAEKDLRRAVELAPRSGDLHYLLGDCLAAQKRFPGAIAEYDKAIQLAPRLRDAIYNRGVILRKMRNYEEAISAQNRVLELTPTFADAWHERAMSLASLGKFQKALEDLNNAVALDPRDGTYLFMRGQVWSSLQTPESLQKSESDLTRALELEPNNHLAYRSRAITRRLLKNWQGSVVDFQEYLRRDPRAPDRGNVLSEISVATMELGQLEAAQKAADESVAFKATPAVLTNRANLFLRKGEASRAVADASAAFKLAPRDARAMAQRGQAYLRLGRYEDAVKDLSRSLELNPDNPLAETLILRGLAFQGQGKTKAFRDDLGRVAQDHPKHMRGLFARGMLRLEEKRYAEAVTDLSLAMDDPVLRPFVRLHRARAWLGVGGVGVAAALADATELAQAQSQEGMAQLETARIFARAAEHGGTEAVARRTRALEFLERAVKLQPELRARLGEDGELVGLRDDGRFQDLLPKE